jgi:cytochrome c553
VNILSLKALILILTALVALPAESFADATAGENKAQLCLLCHKAANATAPLSRIPLLEGLPAPYVYLQTKAFKEKRRDDYAMQTNVEMLSDEDMRDIADYLSGLRPLRASYQLDPSKVAAGKARAEALKCRTCHLPNFSNAGEIPRLAGQTPGYLRAQLEAFVSGKRPHGAGARTAQPIPLTEQDIEALAQFLASFDTDR